MTPQNTEQQRSLAQLEQNLAALEQQRRDLEAELAETRAAEDRARLELAEAHKEAQRREREPQDARELAGLSDRLRQRIAASPKRSYIAAQARQLLDDLESPYCSLTTAAKLDAVQEALRTYQHGLQYADPQRHGPNTWG